MGLYGFACIRCERTVVPGVTPPDAVCPRAPDRGPHEALPSPFLPHGYPPQADYTWEPKR